MKNKLTIILAGIILAACAGGGSELDTKKAEAQKLKAEIIKMKETLSVLEAEIKAEDPAYGVRKVNKVKVVAKNVMPEKFEHKVEMRGSVQSRTNVTLSSEVPGKIVSVLVKEGDYVSKGQLLFALDADIIQNSIAELETSLALAKTLAEKQERLYKQNVGTEVQYLQAKTNKESLENRLATTKAQLAQARVRAPFNATIDQVNAKVGEMTQPGMPMVRIVNPNDVHIKSDVSERFIGKFEKGDEVEIYFPTQGRKVSSKITSIGRVINPENRTFEIEVKLPAVDFAISPNQVVVLNLVDYTNETAFKLPTKVIQRDKQGLFVYELVEEKGKTLANKIYVEAGKSYDFQTEIMEGLKSGQTIALEGFRELAQGVEVEIEKSNTVAGI